MFRRAFWFLLGAISGVLGVAWARRKTDELREAITVESVARLGARTAVALWQRLSIFLVGVTTYVTGRRGPVDETDVPARATTTSTTQRRHIAPQPRSTHR
jgi:hypothetical protein